MVSCNLIDFLQINGLSAFGHSVKRPLAVGDGVKGGKSANGGTQTSWDLPSLWAVIKLSLWVFYKHEPTHRHEPHSSSRGFLSRGRANGLKFTLDCPMLSFPLIFFFLECVSSYVDEFVSFGKEVWN